MRIGGEGHGESGAIHRKRESNLQATMREKGLSGMRCAVAGCIALAAAAMPGFVRAQASPRYQSPVTAPTPLLQLPKLPTPEAKTSETATVVADVVVRVNDQIISRSDVEKAREQTLQDAQQQHLSPAETAQRLKDLLRDMIDKQLLLWRGKQLDINVDTDVIKYLDDLRKQNHLDSMEDLQKAVTASGQSYEDFKASIREELLTKDVVGEEVSQRLRPTTSQVQAYYDEHKSEFMQPEQVGLSEILIATPADASDAALAQAQARANEAAAKVKAGSPFEEVAKQYSGDPTAAQGGELGLFKRGALGQVLEDATFSLPVGGVTAPIRTRQGFVILKVTQHIPAGVQPLQDVNQQVMEAVYNQAIQPALRAYLTKLREDAYIVLKPGYVDSAASPNEINPDISFTAYTPPAPKKKTAVQKARLDRSGHVIAAAGRGSTAAPVATPAVVTSGGASTGMAVNGKKPKKAKREKIRYGQAPRTLLAAGPDDTLPAADATAAASGAASEPGASAAPAGNALVAGNTVDPDVNPLEQTAPPLKKTRFAATEPYHSAPKPKKLSAKAKEKLTAKPTPMTAEEKLNQQQQAAPLGLNGDTTKKPKKPKKVKGAPKERLKDKPAVTPAPVDPTVNPAIGASIPGMAPAPAPAPAPGTTPSTTPASK